MTLIVWTDTPMGRRDQAAHELEAAFGQDYLVDMWREHMKYIREELAAMGAEETFCGAVQGLNATYYKVPFAESERANNLAFMYRKSDEQNRTYLRLWIERVK